MKKLLLILGLFIFTQNAYSHTCPDSMVHLDTAHVCFGFEFTEGPYINERGQRQLSSGIATLDSNEYGLDLSGSHFFLWMKMPNMEHGGRPLSVTYLGDGQFKIENILLTRMPGQWFLRVDLFYNEPHEPSVDYDGEFAITDYM